MEVETSDTFEYLKMKFCIDRDNRTVEITQPAYYDNNVFYIMLCIPFMEQVFSVWMMVM